MNQRLFTVSIFIAFVSVLITSCEKFKGDQEIPAYVTIDSIYITTSPSVQGSASSNISDAWVYLDDNLVGAFQLPARFPVLGLGAHKLTILPGIKLNGISSTRMAYPFYAPIEIPVELNELDTTALGIRKSNYQSSAIFDLIEDFEGISIAFDTTKRSEAALQLTEPGDSLAFEGSHSGMVRMDTVNQFFECVNDKDFIIPYAPVFVEMNFRTNNVFVVGIYLYGPSTIQQVPVIYLNPTGNEWKKIYINLTNSLNAYPGMQKFRIFISAIQSSAETDALILLDNVKVVTRTAE
ncbi:MAG: hypothetical protein IH596_06770 [Bacteroidales bacterium]|nr:hypothetical protein [Bacteroidales bacterium]